MDAPARRHAHSEATRLLCAGSHLDNGFRRRVIDELVGHEERPAAPSLGIDAVSVLAHALRARRREVFTALLLLALWICFFGVDIAMTDKEFNIPTPNVFESSSGADAGFSGGDEPSSDALSVPGGMALFYGAACFFLWAARAVSALRPATDTDQRRRGTKLPTFWGAVLIVPAWGAMLTYWMAALAGFTEKPASVIFPLLMALVIGVQRTRVATVMREELGDEVFPHRRPPELPARRRYRRVGAAIAREQYASMVLYDPHRPFVGAGSPYEPWSLALELKKPVAAVPNQGEVPLTSRTVIDLIKPRLIALRASAERTSRDRLRQLEIEEFVYLPSGVPRDAGIYEPSAVAQHLAASVNEGGEARRHFLRIRVGAWDEQIVLSVLVRVHTQGGMLVLEVVPHVLGPVTEEFRELDTLAARRPGDVPRESVQAVLAAPAATFATGIAAVGMLVSAFRAAINGPERALPDAPLTSVRELGSTNDLSLFQEMDVSRHIKTVQDRIASGVRDALEQSGYETDRFEQQIVNVREGGIFIGEMRGGAVATGAQGRATHMQGDQQ
ncbi:hypothetical protein LHJ74_21710 [Streptomyces sp. N2-109]|uniref:Integral membrane protein n=1 Tax=Streptomyces gossypii TaxID=2883101 RepID=A0ABT2JX61_9ACTN|nr:hypothetical protein [Streptomyces gossypii]MCT2592492.1 hypothetical protein [Streptomyces gossypii]